MAINIEETRRAIAALTKERNELHAKGAELAAKGEDIEALNQNMTAADNLDVRINALQSALSAEIENQSATLKAFKQNSDSVKAAADKFKGLGDFLGCVHSAANVANPVIDPRLAEYTRVCSSASGQNITTAADGGYLVPPEYAEGLLSIAKSQSVLFPEVQRVPVSGNQLVVNEVINDSRKDHDSSQSIVGRNGGFLGYWTAEAAQYTAAKMTFKQTTTKLEKLTGLGYATDEMMEDLPAMGAYIAQAAADEFTFKIDDAILNGTGSGMPLGILAQSQSDPTKNNAALVTIAKESGQAAATIVLANILKMFNAMPAANRANAKWYINQDVEITLMQLLMNTGSVESTGTSAVEQVAGSFGVPLYVPAGGLASAPNGLLLGRPIVPVEQAAALGSLGDITLLDLSQYRWIDKGGIDAQVSMHVRFDYGEQAFRFTYRAGGRPIWSNTISAYKGSTVRSPYVALAARA